MKRLLFLPFFVVLAVAISPAISAERTAAGLLPQSTVLYVEIGQPKKLIADIVNHPLKDRLADLPEVKQALARPEAAALLLGVAFVEGRLGMDLREAIESATGGGVAFAVDAKTKGAALFVKSTDEAKLKKIVDTAIALGQEQAKKSGNEIKQAEYRGVQAYKINDIRMVQVEGWLIAVNNSEFGKLLIDGWKDGVAKPLSEKPTFADAYRNKPADVTAWAYGDISMIQETPQGREFYEKKSDNAFGELVGGGIRPALGATSIVTATLNLSDDGIEISSSMPFNRGEMPETHDFFFAPESEGAAAPLKAKNEILNITAWRDIGRWWLTKEDLFDDKTLAQLSQADSQLSTLFAGLDFGQDILAAAGPRVQIIATRQTYESGPKPDIRIPSIAVVFELKDPEKMQQRLKVAFQSVMGFINIGSTQNGGPQYDINTERKDGSLLVTSEAIVEEGREGMIQYNFSPSISFKNKRFVISTTTSLAKELMNATEQGEPIAANTSVRVNGDEALAALKENRDQLIAQNMLENGHSREEAIRETDLIFTIASQFKSFEMDLTPTKKRLEFHAKLEFATE